MSPEVGGPGVVLEGSGVFEADFGDLLAEEIDTSDEEEDE